MSKFYAVVAEGDGVTNPGGHICSLDCVARFPEDLFKTDSKKHAIKVAVYLRKVFPKTKYTIIKFEEVAE